MIRSHLKSCFRTRISWGNSHDTSLKKLKKQNNHDWRGIHKTLLPESAALSYDFLYTLFSKF